MSKCEHLRLLLAGDEDVPPAVSCWYHFPPEYAAPDKAAEAHLQHLERFDLDFLKVMNEVGYPREALGAAGVVQSVEDLAKLKDLPGDAEPFAKQLELIRLLGDRIGGDVPMSSTIFNAWITLRNLTAPPKSKHSPPKIDVDQDPRDALLTRLIQEDWAALAAALDSIGRTLANFARDCIDAGADGIYLALRDDWVDSAENRAALAEAMLDEEGVEADDESEDGGGTEGPAEQEKTPPEPYDELVAATDREILWAAEDGWLNILHLCGRPQRFERHLVDLGVHVVHWADRVTGPSIADVRGFLEAARQNAQRRLPVIAAGVNNLETLPMGNTHAIAAEVRGAIAAANGYPLIVTPGCTYDPERVRDESVHAMVAAARG